MGSTTGSNREYKSDVFSMLMEEPKHALSVYNALNGSDYRDPSEVEMKKLANSIRLSVRNDASFIIDDYLNLYEHQSSISPNMPLRFLIYITDLFRSIIKKQDLFSENLLKIPTPKFAVFYNGKKDYPETACLKISDAYEHPVGEPELELVCKVYNINPGNNKALLDRCGVLGEYSEFVEHVRSYEEQCPLDEALDLAIDKCIEDHILEDFLKEKRSEVKRMMTLDYTFERRLQLAEEERRKMEGKLKEQLADKEGQLADKEGQLADKEEQLADKEEQLADKEGQLADTEEQLKGALHQIDRMRKILAEHGIESA